MDRLNCNMDGEMTQRFSSLQKLIYICFDQMIWFDGKVEYGYSGTTEDMKI